PIAFLSCTLSNAEKGYFSTEMEILGFVWVLEKCTRWTTTTRSMLIYIFTNYSAILGLSTK
ncbi:hypothetical protein B0H63DRAFT_364680, partial [Podospora didyma]